MTDTKGAGFNKIEQQEAKRDGATPVKNSGRGTRKGDAIMEDFIVDYKFSEKSFTLSTAVWAKLNSDAFQNGRRTPTLKVVLNNDSKPLRLYVIDENTMNELRSLRKYQDDCRCGVTYIE